MSSVQLDAVAPSPPVGPSATVEQTVIWTALPQGRVPGREPRIRVAAFVTPQLNYSQTFDGVTQTSTQLATFGDWVNWPQTLQNPDSPASFTVSFNGGPGVPATVDLSVLNGDYWTAMFGPTTTRVDQYNFEDYSKVPVTTFSATAVHTFVTNLYSTYAGGVALSGASDATSLTLKDSQPTDPTSLPGAAYTNVALRPPPEFSDALSFHQVPPNNSALPAVANPILDFHSAVSALSSYPELLRYFGLLLPLEVELPTGFRSDSTFTVSVTPTWQHSQAAGVGTINVSLETNCTLADATFLPTPFGSDYVGGMLDLGDGTNNSDTFTVVDLDVDGACETLDSNSSSLTSTQELSDSVDSITIDYTLPGLRSSGVSLLWNGWGSTGPGQPSETQPLNALAARQAAIQLSITNWINAGRTGSLQSLFTEDITRGWRLDVLSDDASNPTWRSLHWRLGSYIFGTGGTHELPAKLADPIEGMVIPGVTHAPVADGELPASMLVHESVARWDGWSLAAPRPGNQINDDGTVSAAAGNPMPSSTVTDGSGFINPQVSAEFTPPASGVSVTDPVTKTLVGSTGLPTLRFGNLYQYRARAVDLGGWSLPLNAEAASMTEGTTHYRWDPIRPPLIVPTAPLTPGEGALTIVIRDDGETPPASNARWLFPPKVHELMAEEHGAFDVNGVPDPTSYSLINQYSDGSLATVPGVVNDETGTAGTPNLILPVPATAAPTITWLPDPAAFGLAINSLELDCSTDQVAPSSENPYPPSTDGFLDTWKTADGQSWPALLAKLLVVKPVPAAPLPPNDGIIAVPTLTVTPAGGGSSEVITLSVEPGSVYALQVSSICPSDAGLAFPSGTVAFPNATLSGLGLVSVLTPSSPDSLREIEKAELLGQVPQITPYHTLRVVYAVLLPLERPAFSTPTNQQPDPLPGPVFARASDSTSVTNTDDAYLVDRSSTSRVTYTATWTDPIDNPSDPTNNPAATARAKVTQGSLVVAVESNYDLPVVADPMVPGFGTTTSAPVPFGTVAYGNNSGSSVPVPQLSAEHHIGDTKHHYITYTPTAASRFGQFFAQTTSNKLSGTRPVTLDRRGVDPNLVTVALPATAAAPAVTVPTGLYSVDGPTGKIRLTDAAASVYQGKDQVALSGTPLDITWTPTDTVVGAHYKVHIPSSASPPPLKVVKVAPAWKLSHSGAATGSGYRYKRTGNILRVYLERPWYVTGPDELVGVLTSSFEPADTATPGVPAGVDPNNVTLLGLDPINVSSHDAGASYSQTQLSFVTNTSVPATGNTHVNQYSEYTQPGGNPVSFPSAQDPTAQTYEVWAYRPNYDPITGLWYADIQLKLDDFDGDGLPPGYFLRLALVRLQPFSIPGATTTETGTPSFPHAKYLSATTLVTYAQPVANRTISVVQNSDGSVSVTVSGPGYYGWRPSSTDSTGSAAISDRANEYAEHPNSGGGGVPSTSTMVVEVQAYNDDEGFSGDFGWNTITGFVYALVPKFTGKPDIEWRSVGERGSSGLGLPTDVGALRLRISELEYYPIATAGAPGTVDTTQRRSFVALIPL